MNERYGNRGRMRGACACVVCRGNILFARNCGICTALHGTARLSLASVVIGAWAVRGALLSLFLFFVCLLLVFFSLRGCCCGSFSALVWWCVLVW